MMMLVSVVPDLFPRFSISRVVSICDLAVVSISIFQVLDCFVQFLHLLDYIFLYFFKGFICFLFTYFYLFDCTSLRGLFISLLKASIISMRWAFRSESCFSGVLGLLLQENWALKVSNYIGFCFLCSCACHRHLNISGVNWPGYLKLEQASLDTDGAV